MKPKWTMDRREFMRSATLVCATAGLARLSVLEALPTVERSTQPLSFSQDESDRSPHRDPLAIQNSTVVVDGLNASPITEAHLERLKAGGVNCVVQGAGGIEGFSDTYNFLDAHSDKIVPATTAREIRQARQQGKIAQVFDSQWADFLGISHNQPLGSPRTALRAYYQLGLRSIGLCYNVANIYGGGCLYPNMGLTRAGRGLVEEIHKLRMVLDVGGHTGERTSLDEIEISLGVPVICTHTNVAALNDNPRCTSDRVIEAIAKSGGVIGLTATNDFIARSRKDAHIPHTPQVGLEKYLDQFDYIRKLVGVDHVGLGTDNIEGQANPWERINRDVIPLEMLGEGQTLYVKGFESIAELPNVTRGLIERGWSTGEIRKVLGENWLRVWEKVWGA